MYNLNFIRSVTRNELNSSAPGILNGPYPERTTTEGKRFNRIGLNSSSIGKFSILKDPEILAFIGDQFRSNTPIQ